MSAISAQLLTGVAYGMLYFMIAAGLTIILGVMNVVNLAHGTLFMLGAYIAFTFINEELNFWIALFLAVFLTAIFGLFLEKWLIKHVYGKELEQVLLTFGLSFIIADAVEWIWGTEMHTLPVPDLLSGSLSIGDTAFPVYRLFVVLLAAYWLCCYGTWKRKRVLGRSFVQVWTTVPWLAPLASMLGSSLPGYLRLGRRWQD